MNSRLRIVVTGLIGQYPLGGVTWDYLQYVLGFAQMGHDVYYLEDTGFWPYNPETGGLSEDGCDFNVAYLANVMKQFGLQDKWLYRHDYTDTWYGLSDAKRNAVLSSADLLINVSGCLVEPSRYSDINRMALIDSDPVFTQIKLLLGYQSFRDQIDQHDALFTFAENPAHCIPDSGDHWIPTRQPIVLSEWEPIAVDRNAFTTIMNWTSYEPLEWQSETYGQKDVEFERYIDLPKELPPGTLELAVNDGNTTETPRQLLTQSGWSLVSPNEVCGNLTSYRDYIRSSYAEWSVAKNGYVKGQSGWFSCRSACYLAAGRPVVVQDTGFRSLYPVGEGIVPFSNYSEAMAGVDSVRTNHKQHCDAARAIAESHFASDVVLNKLLENAMCYLPQKHVA